MTDFCTAEAGIRQLQARYTDAVWRKDFAAFGDCFTQDCEWRIAGLIMRGRAEITTSFERIISRFHHALVTLRTPILEVGDGFATGRSYLSEHNFFNDGRPWAPAGIYYERFADQGDKWRFAWRLFQINYLGPPDWSGRLFENPDFGPAPAMPPEDAPTIAHSLP